LDANSNIRRVLVTGGAGYVGAVLVPKLLNKGYRVRVLDLYIYGRNVFDPLRDNPNLEQIIGDIRDKDALAKAVAGCDAVIHLACISNDPSFELDPALGRSINYEAFIDLVELSKKNKVRRFIHASSSSVYGIKSEENVTEDLPLEPLTEYSMYKVKSEEVLLDEQAPGFVVMIVRPATVCGYSSRLRLDLTVNILTNHAVNNGKITVFGGEQKRPNIHIEDMSDLYVKTLEWPDEMIDGKIYNVGYENHTVLEIAEMVRSVVGQQVEIVRTSTDDNRSYHISSEKIRRELGFVPKHSVDDAVRDLLTAFREGRITNPMTDSRYYNLKRMQELELK
jgi:nucleoside-diphosphate-sugar epimerase